MEVQFWIEKKKLNLNLFRASFTVLLAQAILARLDALESDNAVPEPVQLDDDDEASLDDDDQGSFSCVFCMLVLLC